MKLNLNWLSPNSLKKFTNPIDIITFIIPSSGFYFEFIPKLVSCPKVILIVTTIVLAIILYLYTIRKQFKDYERAISEVLETGYFNNFFDKIARNIQQKKTNKQPVKLMFEISAPGVQIPIETNKITVKVILPKSHDELKSVINEIDKITEKVTLETGDWVKARYNEASGTVTIYECPRTLLAISKYLMTNNESYSSRHSEVLHKYFNDKFDIDWNKHFEYIPGDIFVKTNEFTQ